MFSYLSSSPRYYSTVVSLSDPASPGPGAEARQSKANLIASGWEGNGRGAEQSGGIEERGKRRGGKRRINKVHTGGEDSGEIIARKEREICLAVFNLLANSLMRLSFTSSSPPLAPLACPLPCPKSRFNLFVLNWGEIERTRSLPGASILLFIVVRCNMAPAGSGVEQRTRRLERPM
eukprot:759436-Hanusia_phi.AAC.3